MTGRPVFPKFLKAGRVAKSEGGLTIRELYAAAALVGMLANPETAALGKPKVVAEKCREFADAVLEEMGEP